MKRLLPAPLLSLLLFITWLLLNESASVGNLLLAGAFAVAVPWVTERYRVDKPRIKAWGTVVRLGLVVLRDILMSNIDVARRVLGPRRRQPLGVARPQLHAVRGGGGTRLKHARRALKRSVRA